MLVDHVKEAITILQLMVAARDPLTGEHLPHDHMLCRNKVNHAMWIALSALDDMNKREKLSALQRRIQNLRMEHNLDPITGRKLK